MTDSTDELVITQDAVDTIAGAYDRAAEELELLAVRFNRIYSRQPWGTLPSILQLQQMYLDLAVGDNGSAVIRLREFAQMARDLAAWVRSSAAELMAADTFTARNLEDALIAGRPNG
ncbi:hypothetical protein [Tomitella fengzijianii]|uniref:Uncharacterized protein n=1 Tax=Tomitella fengzijianii TaxID=2597660 RepID=A0A516X5Y4_9ACTN|nr:hypothetical protein [Tomitella fengzijianii]QDQ98091.1 hypothetical protein FO059_13190 [Tomitella fengzijianii]